MKLDVVAYLLAGYLVTTVVSGLVSLWFYNGITSVPDSFLTNLVTVDSIASGIVVIIVPISLRTLGFGNSIRDYLKISKTLRTGIEQIKSHQKTYILSKILSASVAVSWMLIPMTIISALGLSIIFSLYAILHSDSLVYSVIALFASIFSFSLVIELGTAMFFVSYTREQANETPPNHFTIRRYNRSKNGDDWVIRLSNPERIIRGCRIFSGEVQLKYESNPSLNSVEVTSEKVYDFILPWDEMNKNPKITVKDGDSSLATYQFDKITTL